MNPYKTAKAMVAEHYKPEQGQSIGESLIEYVDRLIIEAMGEGELSVCIDHKGINWRGIESHYERLGYKTNGDELYYDGGKPWGPKGFIISWEKLVFEEVEACM